MTFASNPTASIFANFPAGPALAVVAVIAAAVLAWLIANRAP